MEVLEDLKYSKDHEWVKVEDDVATVGITDYAQDSLGDIVFLELPDVGSEVEVGDSIAVVESVKSVSDIFSPVKGEVIEVNSGLEDEPEIINKKPYSDGWMYKVKIEKIDEKLMDSSEYEDYVG